MFPRGVALAAEHSCQLNSVSARRHGRLWCGCDGGAFGRKPAEFEIQLFNDASGITNEVVPGDEEHKSKGKFRTVEHPAPKHANEERPIGQAIVGTEALMIDGAGNDADDADHAAALLVLGGVLHGSLRRADMPLPERAVGTIVKSGG